MNRQHAEIALKTIFANLRKKIQFKFPQQLNKYILFLMLVSNR